MCKRYANSKNNMSGAWCKVDDESEVGHISGVYGNVSCMFRVSLKDVLLLTCAYSSLG